MSQPTAEIVGASKRERTSRRRRAVNFWISLGLVALTAAVYAPVRNFSFVGMDDNPYVKDNPHVNTGLTRDNVLWAWTQPHVGTWEQPRGFYAPLTVLSHMLICQFFGLNPGPHHLASVAIHVLNTLLLFAIFTGTTAKPWRSACVAGLFALHPLHVESVAWIAERSDVLSTLFWMLTITAYIGYLRRPGMRRYTLLLAAFAAAILSKPTVMTLPLVLLLLDVWPLRRLVLLGGRQHIQPVGTLPDGRVHPAPLSKVLAEKLPLFFLVGIGSAGMLAIQERSGLALVHSVADRLANVPVSYAWYLLKMCWPTRLAILYPAETPPLPQVIAATALLLGITTVILLGMSRRPYLLVGWLWYLGTLVPVIGLVQTTSLVSRADRYAYVPLIGIFIIVAWGLPDLLAGWRHRQRACAAAALAALAACAVLTARQLSYWRNTLSVFQRALAVTQGNLVAEAMVGNELVEQGHSDEAWEHLSEVLRIAERTGMGSEPYYSDAQANVAMILYRRGDLEGAKQHCLVALSNFPANARAHHRLGLILAAQGDTNGAVVQYREAVRLRPGFAPAHTNLAIALEETGQLDDALTHYAEGVRLQPQNAESRSNFAAALSAAGRFAEAIEQFRTALQLTPQLVAARIGLAAAYARTGHIREAIAELDVLLQQQPDWPPATATLAWLLATADDAQLRDGPHAVRLAEDADRRTDHDNADVLNALAAAYAETGRFADAVATAEHALAVAHRNGQTALLDALPSRLAQYHAGQPVRDHPGIVP